MKKKRYIEAFVAGLLIACMVLAGKQFFSEMELTARISILSDAFFLPGVLLGGFGLLVIVGNGGVFDALAYTVKRAGSYLRHNEGAGKVAKSFYEYQQAKRGEKAEYGFLLISGGFYLLLSVIFTILFLIIS